MPTIFFSKLLYLVSALVRLLLANVIWHNAVLSDALFHENEKCPWPEESCFYMMHLFPSIGVLFHCRTSHIGSSLMMALAFS